LYNLARPNYFRKGRPIAGESFRLVLGKTVQEGKDLFRGDLLDGAIAEFRSLSQQQNVFFWLHAGEFYLNSNDGCLTITAIF